MGKESKMNKLLELTGCKDFNHVLKCIPKMGLMWFEPTKENLKN